MAAFIIYYTVFVGALGRDPVVALGTLGVHPAAAVGVEGGQEGVRRNLVVVLLVWGRGRGRRGRGRGQLLPIELGNP